MLKILILNNLFLFLFFIHLNFYIYRQSFSYVLVLCSLTILLYLFLAITKRHLFNVHYLITRAVLKVIEYPSYESYPCGNKILFIFMWNRYDLF